MVIFHISSDLHLILGCTLYTDNPRKRCIKYIYLRYAWAMFFAIPRIDYMNEIQ